MLLLEVLPREKQGLQEGEELGRRGQEVGGKGARGEQGRGGEKTEVEIRVSAR